MLSLINTNIRLKSSMGVGVRPVEVEVVEVAVFEVEDRKISLQLLLKAGAHQIIVEHPGVHPEVGAEVSLNRSTYPRA